MVSERPARLSQPELQQAAPRAFNCRDRLLTAGLLAAPLGWSLHLALNYGLVYPAYDWQSKASIYLVSVAAAGMALFSIGVGWYGLRRSSQGAMVDTPQRERVRFLSLLACGFGVLFLLAVLAQSVPAVLLPLRGGS
jgi:hypothetical protein